MTDTTTSTVATDLVNRDQLIARAREVRPVLQKNAAETDSLRRLPEEVVRAIRDSGLCRLMVPKRFGGYQTSVRTYIEVMVELGQGCGSTAWVASLINVCAWLAALFPERAQKDVWGPNPDAWIAGSLAPNGIALPVEGGWRVFRPLAVGLRQHACAVGRLRHSHGERKGRDDQPWPLADAD